ncbi:MAG: hypothetical protein GX644_16775 [Limnobacter sp.]|nr:hypothetical protein [Limnobacter sp.]
MMQTIQRLLARIAAVTAIALGAVLALMLAGFTLIAGLVVGLIAMLAAWFGTRSLRGPGAADRGPGEAGRREITVIDVEMREIDETPGDRDTRRARREPDDGPER